MTQAHQDPQPAEAPLAGRLQRLLASIIDLVLLAMVSLLLMLITGLMEEPEAYDTALQFFSRIGLLVLFCYLLIHGAWLFKYGQTLGKRWLKIRMVSPVSDHPPGKLSLLLRAFGLPLLCLLPFVLQLPPVSLAFFTSLLLIDVLFIFSRSRRCLHDHIGASEVRQTGP